MITFLPEYNVFLHALIGYGFEEGIDISLNKQKDESKG